MNKLEHALEVLDSLDKEVGRSIYDQAVKMKNRRRLESGSTRAKRKRFPWSKYEHLYRKQEGVCPWCQEAMILLTRKVEIDHINPNEKDFNADFNLQLLHMECNREKNSMTIDDQAKHSGKTYKQILGEER